MIDDYVKIGMDKDVYLFLSEKIGEEVSNLYIDIVKINQSDINSKLFLMQVCVLPIFQSLGEEDVYNSIREIKNGDELLKQFNIAINEIIENDIEDKTKLMLSKKDYIFLEKLLKHGITSHSFEIKKEVISLMLRMGMIYEE